MAKYYTVLDVNEGQFIATVFENNTNREVYKTKPYMSQLQATNDVNNFLTNTVTPVTEPVNSSTVITNTTLPVNVPTKRGGCCGR